MGILIALGQLVDAPVPTLLAGWQEGHPACKISPQQYPKVLWETLGAASRSWIDTRKNRGQLVKQKPKVVVGQMVQIYVGKTINWMAPWTNQTSRYISFFRPSLNGGLLTGGSGVSDFSVLKYYYLNINYSVNILNECLHILIDCSQLSKTY